MKLVIIGNGFDLNHGLKTSFSNFRTHLIYSKDSSDNNLANDIDSILKIRENDSDNLLWNEYEKIMGDFFRNLTKDGLLKFEVANQFTERYYKYLQKVTAEKSEMKTFKINL